MVPGIYNEAGTKMLGAALTAMQHSALALLSKQTVTAAMFAGPTRTAPAAAAAACVKEALKAAVSGFMMRRPVPAAEASCPLVWPSAQQAGLSA